MSSVSIAHPAARAQQSAPARTPKYLVRGDGVVLHYHPALARLANFQPAEELPEWHVRQLEEAARREEALRVVREAQRPLASDVKGSDDLAAGAGHVPALEGDAGMDSRLRGNDGVVGKKGGGKSSKRRRARAK